MNWYWKIAVLGGSLAAAPAQGSDIAIYGIVHMSIDRQSSTVARVPVRGVKVSSNSSRLGVRAQEDLDHGLLALFQIEGKVNADAGTGGFNNRETFVGVRGALGTVKLGLLEPPIDDLKGIFGNVPTGITGILNTSPLWTNGASDYRVSDSVLNNGFVSMNETLPNSIRYDMPAAGNWRAAVQYAMLNDSASSGRQRNVGSMLAYARCGARAALAVYRNVGVRAPGQDDTSVALALGIPIGAWYAAAVYTRQHSDSGTAVVRRNFWGLSGTYTRGPHRVYGFYSMVGDGSLSKTESAETGAQMAELSYNRDLSRHSTMYVGIVRIWNEANANYQIATNRLATGDKGAKSSGLVFGIKHNF